MPTATWRDTPIATSEDTEVVEGNHYFPRDALDERFFLPSDHTSHCPWKGEAHYLHVKVGDQVNENAAWYYPQPKPAAKQIAGRVAFWRGVEVR
jgi:uncharacterized protein (DUF427 family)